VRSSCPQLVGHLALAAPPPAWHPSAAAIGQPCVIIARLSLSAVAQPWSRFVSGASAIIELPQPTPTSPQQASSMTSGTKRTLAV
jgi:hypothetical protein